MEEEEGFERDPAVHALFPDDVYCENCGSDDPGLQLIDHGDGNGLLCVYCHQEANDPDLPHNHGSAVAVYCEMCGTEDPSLHLADHDDGNGVLCIDCQALIEPESEQSPDPPSSDPEPEPASDHDEEPESNDAKRRRLG